MHTDDFGSYKRITEYHRRFVTHCAGGWVSMKGVSTNIIESLSAITRRAIYATWHRTSRRHPHRFISECTFELNEGSTEHSTLDRIEALLDRAFRCPLTL